MLDLFPYRTLTTQIRPVGDETWCVWPDGREVPIEDFEYGSTVHVRSVLEIDGKEACDDLGLDAASVRLALVFTSRATRLAGQLADCVVELAGAATQRVELTGALPPEVSVDARYRVMALLEKAGPGGDALSPTQAGSLLWSAEQLQIRLEGTTPRLPVAAVEFNQNSADPSGRALWRIEVDGADLDRPLSAAIQVLLNKSHRRFLDLSDPQRSARAKDLVGALQYDLVRVVLRAVIDAQDVRDLESASLEPASLGEFVRDWLDRCFPEGPEAAWARAQTRPDFFDAAVQALTLGGDP